MLTFGIGTMAVLLVIIGAICAVGGYAYAQANQRRAGDGKTSKELKDELGEYKDNVSEHFQQTAMLLNEMTDQYRAVYEHMAAGAQQLCDAEQATSQLESLRTGLLPVLETPADDPQKQQSTGERGVSQASDSDVATAVDAPAIAETVPPVIAREDSPAEKDQTITPLGSDVSPSNSGANPN